MRGGQWQAWYLMRGLREHGHQCRLLTPEPSPLGERARAEGLDTGPLGLFTIRRLAKEADIVHAHSGRAHVLAAAAFAEPLVVSRRVAFPVRRSPASRWTYSRPRRFLAISKHVKQMLLAAGVPENRIRVVYDGAPALEAAAGGTKVISPATDDPRKGAALVREAAAMAGVSVVFSEDLERDLRDAAMLVYITESEGLGSGALLAMSAGVPVIASRVGGLCEVIEDGVTGFLIHNDPAAIAGLIRRLTNDPALRAALGRKARERARERFSLQRMVDGTLKVYHEVLS